MEKSLRKQVLAYADKQYNTLPDKPWAKYLDNEVLRHEDSKKWQGLIFPVDRRKLGVSGNGFVDILNVKCDPVMNILGMWHLCRKPLPECGVYAIM